MYQMIESNFRQKSEKFKKFPFLCENLKKFLNKSDKSASLVIKACRQISSRYIIWSLLINESLDAVDILKKPSIFVFQNFFSQLNTTFTRFLAIFSQERLWKTNIQNHLRKFVTDKRFGIYKARNNLLLRCLVALFIS